MSVVMSYAFHAQTTSAYNKSAPRQKL